MFYDIYIYSLGNVGVLRGTRKFTVVFVSVAPNSHPVAERTLLHSLSQALAPLGEVHRGPLHPESPAITPHVHRLRAMSSISV